MHSIGNTPVPLLILFVVFGLLQCNELTDRDRYLNQFGLAEPALPDLAEHRYTLYKVVISKRGRPQQEFTAPVVTGSLRMVTADLRRNSNGWLMLTGANLAPYLGFEVPAQGWYELGGLAHDHASKPLTIDWETNGIWSWCSYAGGSVLLRNGAANDTTGTMIELAFVKLQ